MGYIKLVEGDQVYIPPGNIVDTGILGPCIGAILYNRSSCEAFAGHFNVEDISGLDEMLDDAFSLFQRPVRMDMYVIGNSPHYPDMRPRADDFVARRYINDITKRNLSRSYIVWSPPFARSRMRLDLDTSENMLEVMRWEKDWKTLYKGDIFHAPDAFDA